MKGKHKVIVSNNKLHYEFEIKRNTTIIQGDSATGKTTLINMLRQAENLGESSGVDVLSNVPCRISFCVSTRSDSRIVIEQNGAESLCVPGELIFRWQNNLIKCQGAYIPDEDIQKSLKKIQHQSKKNINVLWNH